jgi:DNA-binding PadR family transcriptional regulator
MHDLTGFQQDLLFTVAGLDAPNGVEIKSEMEGYYGSEIRHGRLYPNLDTLVEHGLVHKGQKDRRTNEYTLTDEGRAAIADRISWQTDLANAGGINVGRRTIPSE